MTQTVQGVHRFSIVLNKTAIAVKRFCLYFFKCMLLPVNTEKS